MTTLVRIHAGGFREYKEWLLKFVGGNVGPTRGWRFMFRRNGLGEITIIAIEFESEEDAIAFKLKFALPHEY